MIDDLTALLDYDVNIPASADYPQFRAFIEGIVEGFRFIGEDLIPVRQLMNSAVAPVDNLNKLSILLGVPIINPVIQRQLLIGVIKQLRSRGTSREVLDLLLLYVSTDDLLFNQFLDGAFVGVLYDTSEEIARAVGNQLLAAMPISTVAAFFWSSTTKDKVFRFLDEASDAPKTPLDVFSSAATVAAYNGLLSDFVLPTGVGRTWELVGNTEISEVSPGLDLNPQFSSRAMRILDSTSRIRLPDADLFNVAAGSVYRIFLAYEIIQDGSLLFKKLADIQNANGYDFKVLFNNATLRFGNATDNTSVSLPVGSGFTTAMIEFDNTGPGTVATLTINGVTATASIASTMLPSTAITVLGFVQGSAVANIWWMSYEQDGTGDYDSFDSAIKKLQVDSSPGKEIGFGVGEFAGAISLP